MNKKFLYLPLLFLGVVLFSVLVSSFLLSDSDNTVIISNTMPSDKEGSVENVLSYVDPVLGVKELNLSYSSILDIGEPLIVILKAPRASEQNNFNLVSYDNQKSYSPESMVISSTGIVAKWIINLDTTTQIGLFNANGEITHFTVQLVKSTIETTVDTNSPSIVFKNKEFQITTLQVSDELRELSLEPDCPFEITNIDSVTQKQIFHCDIQENTLFNLYKSGENINSFEVRTYPLDYCNPTCAPNQICENNYCKKVYLLAGEKCSSTSLPCITGYECLDGVCQHTRVIKQEGESCDGGYDLCDAGLICNADYVCELFSDNIFYVGLGEYCNNQNYQCDNNNLTCINNKCVLTADTDSQPIIVGFGEYCDNNLYFCSEDLICNGVCTDQIIVTINTSTNQTSTSNVSDNETNNTTTISNVIPLDIAKDNSYLYLIGDLKKEEPVIVKKTNDSQFAVKRFENDLREKVKIPEKATELVKKEPKVPLRVENKEPRNFTLIKESSVSKPTEVLTNKSRDDLTRILQREKVLKTNIAQQQEKANEKVRIQKKIVYEKENKLSEKTQEDVSTKIVIRVEPIENQTSIDVVEVIPKDVALSAQDLIYSVEPIILEDDPVIMWHLENVDEPVELSYRVEKNVSLTGNTILLSDDVKADFDWRTLLPLLFIPLIGGLVVGFSKFEESRKKNKDGLEKL